MTASSDRRRERWRAAQRAHRERVRTAGRISLRLPVTPAEAAKLKDILRRWRRAERMAQLQREADDESSRAKSKHGELETVPIFPAGDGIVDSPASEAAERKQEERLRRLRAMLRAQRGRAG